ncbi:DHH phosphoesterase [Delitschia confertaspora ATCC 74209]|uniref:DHH phosphoesterase n=1 Tax=Delitschia confertaspora ATCC 74209 TaxID=1513339 RepID=A0A9P4JRG2_9PLEO|nr:DHH phosphoesterase [Delitschia confertaspora ATCC 74209]
MSSPLKRKVTNQMSGSSSKKHKITIPEYHLAESRRDESGEIVWPAPKEQIQAARAFIRECAKSQKPTLLLPDKDADGLASGVILHHVLTALGLPASLISVYFPPKGTNIHDSSTRTALSTLTPSYVFILDQGSRKSPAMTDAPHRCLLIDHHFSEDGGFPEGAQVATAHDCPPVATSSLLTYHICAPLALEIEEKIAWIAALGTHGDLGNSLKWKPPFPDMKDTFKRHPKKAINDAVALINAPRRSAAYDVQSAWGCLISATGPESILKDSRLHEAKAEMSSEVQRCTHTAPKFSADATIAVLTINSPAQIHPVIATRWAGHLQSGKLEVVMCANEGYLPGKVNFSCRIAKGARGREGTNKVDIIKTLERIVEGHTELRERLGENFARGHKEASGGIVGKEEWEELVKLMGIGQNVRKKEDKESPKKKDIEKSPQKNTLANYFTSKVKKAEVQEDEPVKIEVKKG